MGKASIEYNKNFTYDTQYRICSNSKLFTAVSMMQLMEAGHFKSIHDPISKYLNANDLEEWGYAEGQKFCPLIYGTTSPCQNITFVSLMSMASGMVAADTCEYSPSEWQYKYCLPNVDVTYYNGSIATFISQFIKIPLQWAPGPTYNLSSTAAAQPKSAKGTYQYNNLNFVILSYFIQKFSGMSLQSYYQKNIFQKVGMSSGTYFDPWFKVCLSVHLMLSVFDTAPTLMTSQRVAPSYDRHFKSNLVKRPSIFITRTLKLRLSPLLSAIALTLKSILASKQGLEASSPLCPTWSSGRSNFLPFHHSCSSVFQHGRMST